ncbi:MAG: Z1 domain-containing protein [Fibrobacter sp.]|nr:Z1 domain-containing protein [Fibrobacter sp.]
MPIDFKKIENLRRSAKSLIEMSGISDDLSEEKLEDVINKSALFIGAVLLPEEFEAIKRDLQYQYQVRCSPGQSILNDYDQEMWYDEAKADIDPKFWTRYKDYLVDVQQFSPNVVNTLGDDTLDGKLMNYIGNPKSEKDFLKRGLIIGDVQSGKTSTYIGLMCKAADAGYKVFILLTGTIESLRTQTQERVEEGFVGVNMSADNVDGVRVGVGLDNKPLFAKAMTSRKRDFTGDIDTIADSLANNNQAVVFVIKKNITTLKKLTDWLVKLNADAVTKKINVPMLMIDDEADNASINTSGDKEDPSKINKAIRKLANVFTKSNYVGFTATPFANVFIDPQTTEEMENADLFPEDFIVALPTPDNYVGATKIFSEDGIFHNQLVYIEDAGSEIADGWSFYYKHKKDWRSDLPDSLTDAIYAFYIANTLRDLRGDNDKHRSMLVNISRFVAVQKYIKEEIDGIHAAAYRAIKYNLSGLSSDLRDPILKRIHDIFEKYYANVEFEWSDVAKNMFKAIESIKIRVVNSSKSSEKLVYPKKESLRVIAIGGLALSRGLTLEGLITSYFYRNTSTYDVLMQMGRWFGYRRNYEDLFRIWTAESSSDWYAEIAEATERLKRDMNVMRDKDLKPKDFGIRVRNNSNELQITSYNKMRNTTDEYDANGFFGGSVETQYLEADANKQIKNFETVKTLVDDCVSGGIPFVRVNSSCYKGRYMLQDVPKSSIKKMLKNFSVSPYCLDFDPNQITKFLSECNDPSIDYFDVAFMDGSDDSAIVNIGGVDIHRVVRNKCKIDSEREKINIGSRGKLSGPGDGMVGIVDVEAKLAKDIIEQARENFKVAHSLPKDTKTLPTDAWFEFVKDRKPLVMIYLMNVNLGEDQKNNQKFADIKEELGENVPFTAIMMGFPQNDEWSSMSFTRYKANKSYNYYELHKDDDVEEVE